MHANTKKWWADQIRKRVKDNNVIPLTDDQLKMIIDVIESECDHCRSETEWRNMGGSI